jgi:peptidoglycan/xylan/chitin deacetylase (PgdA/CDA1 family)
MLKNKILVILLLCAGHIQAQPYSTQRALQEAEGAYYRADTSEKVIYLNFTAHELYEGLPFVKKTLDSFSVKASFFLTGDFIRKDPNWTRQLYMEGHYVGPHSDKHLLYCDWTKRDSLLESMENIKKDIVNNQNALKKLGIPPKTLKYFMPPYEWYNRAVYDMVNGMGITMVNFTPGTSSNADYTTPDLKNYVSSDTIMARIKRYERSIPSGLNGFHLLIHVGTEPARTDKLYNRLPELLTYLKSRGYRFSRYW